MGHLYSIVLIGYHFASARQRIQESTQGDEFFQIVSGRMDDAEYTKMLRTSDFCLHVRGFQVGVRECSAGQTVFAVTCGVCEAPVPIRFSDDTMCITKSCAEHALFRWFK